jgi:hypothetical protein
MCERDHRRWAFRNNMLQHVHAEHALSTPSKSALRFVHFHSPYCYLTLLIWIAHISMQCWAARIAHVKHVWTRKTAFGISTRPILSTGTAHRFGSPAQLPPDQIETIARTTTRAEPRSAGSTLLHSSCFKVLSSSSTKVYNLFHRMFDTYIKY